MNKKYIRLSAKHSLDARTPKTSKHSSEFNSAFLFFFHVYLKTMHIADT